MHKSVFLDYASCTPINEEILTTYEKLLRTCFINSEAVYQKGLEVHNLVEKSRNQIAQLMNVNANEIIFTSGASESNSFAIKGYCFANQKKGKHIISTQMEHSSVLHSLMQLRDYFGFEVTMLPVHKDGKVYAEDVEKAMREDTILVSIMSVNNEIGSIQDIEAISKIVHKNSKTKFHVDAVQSVGKIVMNLKGVDLLSFTSHKIYGVKGCGILYKKRNVELLALIHGGQQEQGIRGGTLDAPACIVFAKTLRLALENMGNHYAIVETLNKYMRNQLKDMNDIVINSPDDAIPYILNFSCVSISSEVMMNALNLKNICVSTQSTCSSRTKAASHTLKAMNLRDEIAYGAIRVSFSHMTTKEEIDYLIENLKEIINEYRTK